MQEGFLHEHSMAFHNKGESLAALGMHLEAIDSYTKAIEDSPDRKYPYAFNNKGASLADLGMHCTNPWIKVNGFEHITLQKEKSIIIPYDILTKYLNDAALTQFKTGKTGIFSITVYAEKPAEAKTCCGPECCN